MRRAVIAPALVVVGALGLAAPAAAEPRAAASGPYAEASVGASGFLGDGGQYSRPGPAFGLRGGLDLFSWLSLGGRLELESHEADVPPPPEGEYFQLYLGAAEARLGARFGRFALFADGGLGLAFLSTNVLAKVDLVDPGEKWSPLLSVGGGLEYQLQNRHYGLGVAGQWMVLSAFESMQSVGGRAYLRYTY
jgi:hypothetical protein